MFEIVIATHGKLSDGLKEAAEIIFGMATNIKTINLNPETSLDGLGAKIKSAIEKVTSNNGALILTDIVNGTPYNQAILVVTELEKGLQDNIYVIGGVNLPMLLEAINLQILETPLSQVVDAVNAQGWNGISGWHTTTIADFEDDEELFVN